jgi:hypothetical protein
MPLQSQARHFNLSTLAHKAVNGQVRSNSEDKFTLDSLPDPYQVLCSLQFLIKTDRDRAFLNSILDPNLVATYGGSMPIKIMLGSKGYFSGYPWGSLPLNLAVSPKILAACLIVNDGIPIVTSPVQYFADRLAWRGVKPNLMIISPDIFYVHPAATLATDEQLMKYYEVKRLSSTVGRSRKQTTGKSKYIEASNNTNYDLHEARISGQVFSNSGIDLILEPVGNRGNTIATVKYFDRHHGVSRGLGQIKLVKGKLFFSCPSLTSGQGERDKLDATIRGKQITKKQYDKRILDLKAEISQLGSNLIQLRARIKKTTGVDLKFQIAQVELDRAEKQRELSALNQAMPDIQSDLRKLDPAIASPLLSLLKDLGLNPNNFLKSLPKRSPLADMAFWLKNFWVVTEQADHSHPILMIRDTRKGSSEGSRERRKKYPKPMINRKKDPIQVKYL